jgi:hypothetical protein
VIGWIDEVMPVNRKESMKNKIICCGYVIFGFSLILVGLFTLGGWVVIKYFISIMNIAIGVVMIAAGFVGWKA